MSNVQYSYPLDITGTSSVNKVTSEVHTVTAVNNRNYHFLIPVFAPFFAESVKLYKQVEKQNKVLESNKKEINELQTKLNQLIGNGCHVINCKSREPYSMEEINSITK